MQLGSLPKSEYASHLLHSLKGHVFKAEYLMYYWVYYLESFMCKRRVYPEWFIESIVNKEDKDRAISGELKTNEIIELSCSKGHHFRRKILEHVSLSTGEHRNGCPICHKFCRYDFPQWFIEELAYCGDKEKAMNREINADSIVDFVCKEGHVYSMRVYDKIKLSTGERRCGCPECKNKTISESLKNRKFQNPRKYPRWFIDILAYEEDKEKARRGILVVTDKVWYHCKQGHLYERVVSSQIVLSNQNKIFGCPICNSKIKGEKHKFYFRQFRKYPKWFIEEIADPINKERAKSGELTTLETIVFQCKEGHQYSMKVCNHIELKTSTLKQKCPVCTKHRSKYELEVEKFVMSLGYKTTHGKIIKSNQEKRKNLEIDIFIPEKNIGIEFCGSYYHKTYPKDKFSKSKDYHYNKFSLCSQQGILLITIFDKFWFSQKERIKGYLLNILSGKEDSLSFNEEGLMNNNYPSLQYFKEVGNFIEDFYTYYKMTVYTCGFSNVYKLNIRGTIEKGGMKASVDLGSKGVDAKVTLPSTENKKEEDNTGEESEKEE